MRVGDNVTFDLLPPMKLKNNIVAGKTFDDRACITVMLEAMDILKKSKLDCQVIFCATVQEECGGGRRARQRMERQARYGNSHGRLSCAHTRREAV